MECERIDSFPSSIFPGHTSPVVCKEILFKNDRVTEDVEQNQSTAHAKNGDEEEDEEDEDGVSEENKLISVV